MKKVRQIFCLAIASFIVTATAAQMDSARNLPNFLLPSFSAGIIKFKTGTSKTGVINYNIIDQELVILQDAKYMVIANPELIDTIFVDGKKLVPFNAAFCEVLVNGPVSLLFQRKVNPEQQGTPTGYGATSNTLGNAYVKQIYGNGGTIDLRVPEDIKLSDDNNYWIKKGNDVAEKFYNKRQFLKLFSNNEKEINKFIDSSNINFKKTDDVAKLVAFSAKFYKVG